MTASAPDVILRLPGQYMHDRSKSTDIRLAWDASYPHAVMLELPSHGQSFTFSRDLLLDALTMPYKWHGGFLVSATWAANHLLLILGENPVVVGLLLSPDFVRSFATATTERVRRGGEEASLDWDAELAALQP